MHADGRNSSSEDFRWPRIEMWSSFSPCRFQNEVTGGSEPQKMSNYEVSEVFLDSMNILLLQTSVRSLTLSSNIRGWAISSAVYNTCVDRWSISSRVCRNHTVSSGALMRSKKIFFFVCVINIHQMCLFRSYRFLCWVLEYNLIFYACRGSLLSGRPRGNETRNTSSLIARHTLL